EVQPRNGPAGAGPEHDRRPDELPGRPRANVLRRPLPPLPRQARPVHIHQLLTHSTPDAKVDLSCLYHPAPAAPGAIDCHSHLDLSFRPSPTPPPPPTPPPLPP